MQTQTIYMSTSMRSCYHHICQNYPGPLGILAGWISIHLNASHSQDTGLILHRSSLATSAYIARRCLGKHCKVISLNWQACKSTQNSYVDQDNYSIAETLDLFKAAGRHWRIFFMTLLQGTDHNEKKLLKVGTSKIPRPTTPKDSRRESAPRCAMQAFSPPIPCAWAWNRLAR